MPATFTPAPLEVNDIANRLIVKYFPDVQEVETTFGFWMAHAQARDDEGPKPPALKLNGYPCAALIRLTPYKDRLAGLPDVRIEIDAEQWEAMGERARMALIHHELSHLELKRDEDGSPKCDDAGRPKFKLKPHDFQVGVFKSTMKLFGQDCLDTQNVMLAASWVQKEIAWG